MPVNTILVNRGLAWWYEKYAPNDINLREAQIVAKRETRGLWGATEFEIVAPWDWRKLGKSERDLLR